MSATVITIEVLVTRVPGLPRQDIERWVANRWIRPERDGGQFVFHEIDVARVTLIRALRDEMEVNEDALPVVLSLLDQLYDLRRRMTALGDVLAQAPDELRHSIAAHLAGSNEDSPDRRAS